MAPGATKCGRARSFAVGPTTRLNINSLRSRWKGATLEERNCVVYTRVSTERQGRSGLGLNAQEMAVENYLKGARWTVVGRFTEVESGKRADRVELAKALAACKKHKATLVVAKLDRLSRNLAFIANVMEAGIEFVAFDLPFASRLTLHVLAAVAEHERVMISIRTKEALASAKARGVKLGATGPRNLRGALERRRDRADTFAEKLRVVLEGLRARGLSQRAIVGELNGLGIKSPGGGTWHLQPLQRVLARLAATRT